MGYIYRNERHRELCSAVDAIEASIEHIHDAWLAAKRDGSQTEATSGLTDLDEAYGDVLAAVELVEGIVSDDRPGPLLDVVKEAVETIRHWVFMSRIHCYYTVEDDVRYLGVAVGRPREE